MSTKVDKVKMKMYVWEDPYGVPWGNSLLIVVAESLPNARRLAMKSAKERWPKNFDAINKNIKPTRILSLPCVEWHEWSE